MGTKIFRNSNIFLKVIENANRWDRLFLDLMKFVPTRNTITLGDPGCFGWVQMSSNPKINDPINLHFQLKIFITVYYMPYFENYRPHPRGWGKIVYPLFYVTLQAGSKNV